MSMHTSHRGAQLPYRPLAGVVPCPGGWLVAGAKLQGITLSAEAPQVFGTLLDVLDILLVNEAHHVFRVHAM